MRFKKPKSLKRMPSRSLQIDRTWGPLLSPIDLTLTTGIRVGTENCSPRMRLGGLRSSQTVQRTWQRCVSESAREVSKTSALSAALLPGRPL